MKIENYKNGSEDFRAIFNVAGFTQVLFTQVLVNSQFSILNWKDSVFLREFGVDFVVGVAGQLFYQRAVHIGIQTYRQTAYPR